MSWHEFIENEKNKAYYNSLNTFLQNEVKKHTIYPPQDLWFNAFKLTPFNETKVVIIGQDPYHQPNQAMGLAFSVNPGVKLPKSLINIFKELESDLNTQNTSGSLIYWAKQGVLLLNTTLTVRQNQPLSHKNQGWEIFTTNAISTLCEKQTNLVFILWGKQAASFKPIAIQHNHSVITSPHPSPLSAHRGFFGSKPFSKANEYLKAHHKTPIDWRTI